MIEMARTLRLLAAVAAAACTASAAAAEPTAGAPAPDLARGQALFGLCTQCHGDAGAGNPAIEAPAIAALPAWYVEGTLRKFKSGGRGTHPDDYAGMRMRPMSMTLRDDADVVHVAAYVAGLPAARPAPLLTGGDATRGANLYAPCIACHMPDGSGNPALGSPPLKHASDWYLLAQLKKFKGGVRGTNPLDINGALMVGMSQLLADEQAMRDVIAHIMTLAN